MNTALIPFVMVACALTPLRTWDDAVEHRVPQMKRLYLDLSAGSYAIVAGSSTDTVKVRWTAEGRSGREVRIRVDQQGSEATLRARGPRNNFRVEIEVPRDVELDARLSVGELKVKGVVGHKTLSCRVGEIEVAVPDPSAYRNVEAAVKIGDIAARAFGRTSSGFFRSFRWTGQGTFKLDAHVGIGDVRFTEER